MSGVVCCNYWTLAWSHKFAKYVSN